MKIVIELYEEEASNVTLEDLIGGKIIEAGEDEDDGEFWPTLLVEKDDGSLIGVVASRDDEGNGGGALFIEPVTLDTPA